jgi:hypothetical protein
MVQRRFRRVEMASDHVKRSSSFDPTSPCLVLAPHLEYPVRAGGDILIDKKWSRLSEYVPFVDIIGKDTITRYENGRLVERVHFANIYVSKTLAAFNTLTKRSHYLLEKHLTPRFAEQAHLYLARPEYKTVVCSFIWTAAVVTQVPEIEGRVYCVETHNDEIEWFEHLRRSSTNPLAKLTAYFSERWARTFLNRRGSDFVFFYLSRADQEGYSKRFPGLRGYIVPIGVDEVSCKLPWQEDLTPSGKVRLLFVGLLSAKINLDAIEFFKEDFYPLLKTELGGDLEILVVESNPSDKVSRLCRDTGWTLYPDVSDEELRRLYRTSTFSILPFRYTTGSKLKLLHSLANGVPYLATLALRGQVEKVMYPCLISSDPEEWLHHIQEVRIKRITNDDRTALMDHARKYSWASVARQTFQLLSHDA